MSRTVTRLFWGLTDCDAQGLDVVAYHDVVDAYDTPPEGLVFGDGYVGVEVAELSGVYDAAALLTTFAVQIDDAKVRWATFRAEYQAGVGFDVGDGFAFFAINEDI